MNARTISLSRPAITKLLIAAVLMLGALGLFVVLAGNASAGGDAKVTVNSTANTDDGDCEGAPNEGTGNCTLHEAIDAVNNGDADIINFHPPVFSKEQPGVINLCANVEEGQLPDIMDDVVIDSKDSGVILDGGTEDDDCDDVGNGLRAEGFGNGLDFELNGGKNFTIRNFDEDAIVICGGDCDGGESLGTIVITGVIIENVEDRGIDIIGSNLESLSVTNNDIETLAGDAVRVDVVACSDDGLECKLTDSVIDISGNRINGGIDDDDDGVDIEYIGRINSGTKITIGVTQNEVINGTEHGVDIQFDGCGSGGLNVHVDENEEINGQTNDGVRVDVFADQCEKDSPPGAVSGLSVDPGDTSDDLEVVVTVNGNGDIENHDGDDGVEIFINICCEESDSSATIEVNDNGRITGEDWGVIIATFTCCGDDNVSDTKVNNNDEITGEDGNAIEVLAWAGSSSDASQAGVAGSPTGFDADDNVCTITVDGNNELDGVGWHGVNLECFAGTFGDEGVRQLPILGPAGVPPLSSGDGNVATIIVSNNSDIDGDDDGVHALAAAGSTDGEGDDNLATVSVTDNREITGDEGDGVDATVAAGSQADEGDDNSTEIVITGNEEIGGNGGDGLNLNSLSGGITAGSEDNHTSVLVDGNGSIEGSGGDGESIAEDDGGDGIDINTIVCCDEANTNTITITNNTDEITGHNGDGIDIGGFPAFGEPIFDGLCCSANIITIMDNAGNIRGGDDDGLELQVCVETEAFSTERAITLFPSSDEPCIAHSVTALTVINNSFSDSENDGINICCGAFQLEEFGIKSIISNNVIEGNGGDGIDVESSIGLNIGPGNEIFENGTSSVDNGVEIGWCMGFLAWLLFDNSKVPANSNTITQNSIYDNAGLGIDLVGFDPSSEGGNCSKPVVLAEGVVGCVPFPETAINPNDCIAFPDLQTQAGDKLIGTTCSECHVEVFWADDDPDNQDGHGEGATYIVTGTADVDGDFSIELPCDLGEGELTATATDKLKNTSEFAANLTTLGTSSCATDTPVPPDETDTPVPPDPTATPEPTKTCGDVNMDGSVNSVDATLILQLKAGLIDSVANESSADVDNDGNVTSIDASLILQATAGLIDESALTCP